MIASFCESWLLNEGIRKRPEGCLLERYAEQIRQIGYAEHWSFGLFAGLRLARRRHGPPSFRMQASALCPKRSRLEDFSHRVP